MYNLRYAFMLQCSITSYSCYHNSLSTICHIHFSRCLFVLCKHVQVLCIYSLGVVHYCRYFVADVSVWTSSEKNRKREDYQYRCPSVHISFDNAFGFSQRVYFNWFISILSRLHNGEESIYTYNGLGALMEQTWIIAKNGYGYHGVDAVETPEPDVPDPDEPTKPVEPEDPDIPDPGVNNEGNGNNNGSNGNGHVNGNNGNHYGNQEENPEEETTTASANGLTATLVTYGNAGNGNNGNNGNGNGNQDKPTGSNVKKHDCQAVCGGLLQRDLQAFDGA